MARGGICSDRQGGAGSRGTKVAAASLCTAVAGFSDPPRRTCAFEESLAAVGMNLETVAAISRKPREPRENKGVDKSLQRFRAGPPQVHGSVSPIAFILRSCHFQDEGAESLRTGIGSCFRRGADGEVADAVLRGGPEEAGGSFGHRWIERSGWGWIADGLCARKSRRRWRPSGGTGCRSTRTARQERP